MINNLVCGDSVYYGAVKGVLLGVYAKNEALFMSNSVRANFNTAYQITLSVNAPYRYILQNFIKRYHQIESNKPELLNVILSQQKYLIVPMESLKVAPIEHKHKELVKKRHLYITMARNYIRYHRSDDSIQNMCKRIEDIQLDIDLIETKAQSHLQKIHYV